MKQNCQQQLTEKSVRQLFRGSVHITSEDNEVSRGRVRAVAGHQVDVLCQLVRLTDAMDGILVRNVLLFVVLGVHLRIEKNSFSILYTKKWTLLKLT